MKLTRRSFIKFAVGAVGGIHLTPLPWYLMDDAAIWSQNWWFRQVPKKGALTSATTVCTLCPGGCGIEAGLISEKRAIGISGNTSHPVSMGAVCPIGASGPQFTYGLSRVKTPLKQTGKRGDRSSFKKIGWDKAIEEVGAKLASLGGNGERLAAVGGARGSLSSELFSRLIWALGSDNLFRVPSSADSEELASLAMTGVRAPFSYDLVNSRYVLSLGCGVFEGWGSPVWVHQTLFGNNGETRLVQVDSRMSPTAAAADRWVAVEPGTEAVFALGMANVIVQQGLYDRGFVGSASGFGEFRRYLAEEYPLDFVSDLCGVEPREIVSVAREFAGVRPAVALWGRGKGSMPDTLFSAMAALALNGLVGSVGARGGVLPTPQPPLADWPDLAEVAPSAQSPKSYLDFLSSIEAASGPEVLLINQANPAYGPVAPALFKKALAKVSTVVCIGSYMDETALSADYVLPADAFLETLDGAVTPRGMPYPVFSLVSPALERLYDTKPAGEIILRLAKAAGDSVAGGFPWENWEEALKARAQGIVESKRGAVSDEETAFAVAEGKGVKVAPNFGDLDELWGKLGESAWFDPGQKLAVDFQTNSGRFTFSAAGLKGIGLGKKNGFPRPLDAPLSGDPKKFPLILVPVELLIMPGESLGAAPYLVKMLRDDQLTHNDVYADVSPRTAKKLRLKQGAMARLATPQGALIVRVNLTEAARPGVVYLPVGLGHTAYDKFLKNKGANPYEVLEFLKDKETNEVSWWGARASLSKV